MEEKIEFYPINTAIEKNIIHIQNNFNQLILLEIQRIEKDMENLLDVLRRMEKTS